MGTVHGQYTPNSVVDQNIRLLLLFTCFFFNDPPTTQTYTLSLHDALPISIHGALSTNCMAAVSTRKPPSSGSVTTNPANDATSANQRTEFGCASLPIASSSAPATIGNQRSEEHTSELQSQFHLVCRLLLEK